MSELTAVEKKLNEPKLSQTQIYTLRRMGIGNGYLARGDGRKGDEMRIDRAYSAPRRVNAPSIPPLIRLGFVEFVNDGDLDYNALYDSLCGMKMFLEANTDQPEGGRRVGFPKIGAGLGGGDWSVISAMISTIFCDEDVTIYVLNKSELPQQELEVGE